MAKDLEVKIQDEIRKKVIEEEFKRSEADASDNISALSETTSLPPEEVERIAKEIRVEQTLKNTFKKVALIGVGVFGAAAAVLGAIVWALFL